MTDFRPATNSIKPISLSIDERALITVFSAMLSAAGRHFMINRRRQPRKTQQSKRFVRWRPKSQNIYRRRIELSINGSDLFSVRLRASISSICGRGSNKTLRFYVMKCARHHHHHQYTINAIRWNGTATSSQSHSAEPRHTGERERERERAPKWWSESGASEETRNVACNDPSRGSATKSHIVVYYLPGLLVQLLVCCSLVYPNFNRIWITFRRICMISARRRGARGEGGGDQAQIERASRARTHTHVKRAD